MMTVTDPTILMTLVAQHRQELIDDATPRRVGRGRHGRVGRGRHAKRRRARDPN